MICVTFTIQADAISIGIIHALVITSGAHSPDQSTVILKLQNYESLKQLSDQILISFCYVCRSVLIDGKMLILTSIIKKKNSPISHKTSAISSNSVSVLCFNSELEGKKQSGEVRGEQTLSWGSTQVVENMERG